MLGKIKDQLKKNKLIYRVNAKYKCYQTKKKYNAIMNYYKNKELKTTFEELLNKKGFTKEWKEQFKTRKINIFYIGTDERQDKSGFLQALGKECKLIFFTKIDGSYGQYSEKMYGNKHGRELNTETISLKIEELNNLGEKPDILMMQSWGRLLNIDKILELKNEYKLKIINIGMEERLVYRMKTPKRCKYNRGTSGLIPICDLMLVTSPECPDWYNKEGVPAIYFPFASSLDFYYPMNIKKIYDVGFIGSKYGVREKLVNALMNEKINVIAHGEGWPAGRIPLEKSNEFFNKCKIVLGIGTIGYCENFYTLKLRDFDAPLSGSMYITHNNPDLSKLFKADEEMVFCDKIEDYIRKIKYYLANEDELHKIANNGYNKAKKFHTYEKRFHDLFNVIFRNGKNRFV